jgi:hypothetical protein
MKMMRQKYAVATIAFLLLVGIAPAIIAGAQSPTPASKMTNVVSSDSYPTGYGVGIIEGLGFIGSCSYDPYTIGDLETAAVNWIDASHQTIVEITPQTSCGASLSLYESRLNTLSAYIKSNVTATAFTRYWGGFMLDEEPGYWASGQPSVSYTFFTTLNSYVYNNLSYSTLSPYSELSNLTVASHGWTQSQYESIATNGQSTAAPQIYNANILANQNSLVTNYLVPTLVTCYPSGYPSYSNYATCADALAGPRKLSHQLCE